MFKNIIDCWKHIPYTWKHYLAFRKTEKLLIGQHLYLFHDWDKIFMYIFLPYLGTKRIKAIHKRRKHHITEEKSDYECNYEEAIIDWECAKLTKPDKPENAFEYVMSHKRQSKHYLQLLNALKNLKLITEEQYWNLFFEDITL